MARTVIFGKSGSGKSWYTGQRLAEILEPDDPDLEFERAVHLDLEDEEKGLSLEGDALLLTFEVDKEALRGQVLVDESDPPDFIPEKELRDGPIIALPKYVFYQNKYVRVVPDGLSDSEVVALAELMADAAMLAGDTHFSMDEAHRVAQQGKMKQRMEDLITGGRKREVEWAFISQRPQLLDKTIIAQADIGCFFQLTSERDVMKADSLAESFDAEDVLPGLPDRTVIIEDYSSGEVRKVDTNDLERAYPHVASDDGKANETWLKDGEVIEGAEETDSIDDETTSNTQDNDD